MGKRLRAWLTGLGIFGIVGAAILLGRIDSQPHPYRLGEIESLSEGVSKFEPSRPMVLETGVDGVRGLACGADGRIYLAKTDGKVLSFTPGAHPEKREKDLHQLAGRDLRGIAFDSGSLFLAEHGLGLVAKWDKLDGPIAEVPMFSGGLTGPSGIAVAGKTIFVTDDRPWPAAGQETAFDSSDYARWVDKTTQRLFGSLMVMGFKDGEPEWTVVPARLRHPSGIAAASPDGPVYVAEADASEVRWPIFIKGKDRKWSQTGALGAVPTGGVALPPFLGVAIAGNHVFAAGPNSLYIFDGKIALGRIAFDYPVSGVAAAGKDIYMVVGDRLCHFAVQ